jgi:hypothetical protein
MVRLQQLGQEGVRRFDRYANRDENFVLIASNCREINGDALSSELRMAKTEFSSVEKRCRLVLFTSPVAFPDWQRVECSPF